MTPELWLPVSEARRASPEPVKRTRGTPPSARTRDGKRRSHRKALHWRRVPSLTLDQPWLSHQRKRDKRRYRITGQSEDGRACDVTKCQWLTGLDRQLPEIQRPPLLNLRFDVVLFTHRDATSRDDAIRLCGARSSAHQSDRDHPGGCRSLLLHAERPDLGGETKAIAVEDLTGIQITATRLAEFVSGRQHRDVERSEDRAASSPPTPAGQYPAVSIDVPPPPVRPLVECRSLADGCVDPAGQQAR